MHVIPEKRSKELMSVLYTAEVLTSVIRYGCPLGHSVGKMGHMAQNPIPIHIAYGKMFQKGLYEHQANYPQA